MKNKQKKSLSSNTTPYSAPPPSCSVPVKVPEPTVPEKCYSNSDTYKAQILSENSNKSGIYMWENLINKKQYIGSSENLKKRFQQYFNTNHLIKDNCMQICRALLKYDYFNFSLTIIEYCSPDKCIEREKYYINLFGSEYNTIKDTTLPPMSGRTHSDKTKTKISDTKKGTNVSDKTKQIMSDIKKGSNHPMFGKNHTEETKQIISDAMIGNTNKKGKPRAEGAGKPSQIFKQ